MPQPIALRLGQWHCNTAADLPPSLSRSVEYRQVSAVCLEIGMVS